MKKQHLDIEGIPAILWGEAGGRLFLAVHGDRSHKSDDAIVVLAEEAAAKGYQTLSFDLPEHGERKEDSVLCKVQTCAEELGILGRFARTLADDISLFGCSIGAYFSLLAFQDIPLGQALFLSPILDMERLIRNMMGWFGIEEEQLRRKGKIPTPAKTLYWDYFCYVKAHPVSRWNTPTDILYGEEDELTERVVVDTFVRRFPAKLTVMEKGEHHFHTGAQLDFYRAWLARTMREGHAGYSEIAH